MSSGQERARKLYDSCLVAPPVLPIGSHMKDWTRAKPGNDHDPNRRRRKR